MSHCWEVVSCSSSHYTDLQPLVLLLVPFLHFLQLGVQSFRGFPELHRLILIIPNLRQTGSDN